MKKKRKSPARSRGAQLEGMLAEIIYDLNDIVKRYAHWRDHGQSNDQSNGDWMKKKYAT